MPQSTHSDPSPPFLDSLNSRPEQQGETYIHLVQQRYPDIETPGGPSSYRETCSGDLLDQMHLGGD